jgi:phosphate transport system permease protein
MVGGLMLFVFAQGMATFWPRALEHVELRDGRAYLGEIEETEEFQPAPEVFAALPEAWRAGAEESVRARGGTATRRLLRRGNFELTGEHYHWISDFEVATETRPEWAVLVERLEWGRFYGEPRALLVDGQSVATDPARVLEPSGSGTARSRAPGRAARARGARHRRAQPAPEGARPELRGRARARQGLAEWRAQERAAVEVEGRTSGEIAEVRARIDARARERALRASARHRGGPDEAPAARRDRAPGPRIVWFLGKLGVYLSRWREFLLDDPRASNSEGGVFPAIFGTVTMTLLMTFLVVPIGVLAALYLREYAKAGFVVSAVRIAINNLAGVPSIVYGVFGLGFFCYGIGAGIDRAFFASELPSPTFGTGGVLWAALTLALLTLPVVIVATEEALAAVPNSMREGSFACGASKWQTIRRIVLPRAMPGITTG